MKSQLLTMIALALFTFVWASFAQQEQRFPKSLKGLDEQVKPPSSQWLLDANDDAERFRRLQIVASGTDKPMWEVGYRFKEVHNAIQKSNPELAAYQWGKIKKLVQVAGLKRPKRTPNLEAMFLENGVWEAMNNAIKVGNVETMKEQFLVTRQGCITCHDAEKMGFINDVSVFEETKLFPESR